tara:strand:- start:123 stop:251 length:129 start_codon:yes stop_codon:yes gene_type:complete
MTEGRCIMAAMKEDRGELDLTRQLEEKDNLYKNCVCVLEICY